MDAALQPPREHDAYGTQMLAARQQTLTDADQTCAGADQESADCDQTSADIDQFAADRDQAASDHDLAHGVDPEAYEFSREVRRRNALRRGLTASARLASAAERDAIARRRDLAAAARDELAVARDEAMDQRDSHYGAFDRARVVTGAEVVVRAAGQRKRAAEYREESARQRELAAADRAAAARDRAAAAGERLRTLADIEALARSLAGKEFDPLTGAHTRAAGLADLDRELDRCRRVGSALVVAYVDVGGLKTVHDGIGHAAGDAQLKRVVTAMRSHLRSYDLVIRLGGDAFLCAMPGMTLPAGRRRFGVVAREIGAARESGAIRVGFAELLEQDGGADELIARADRELVEPGGG